ncbi:MAG: S9 family peptidase [Bacteroidaceae bacterium]|nr:S9 family peptidase [Bacteroidaceae bacterium]
MNKSVITFLAAGVISMAQKEAQAQTFIGRQTPKIENRTLTPELLWAMGRIGGSSVSPDAKQIAYNVSYYSVAENKSHTVIYTLNTDGTNEKLLTTQKGSELAPKYLKNGKITFLAADADGTMQLWMMNADGSARQQISKGKRDIEDYIFSLDEKLVLVIHSVPYTGSIAAKPADLPKTSGYVVNEAMYRHWDEWVEAIPQPFIYHFNGTELSTDPIPVMGNEPFESPMKPFGGIEQLCWSPNSKCIAYTCRKKTGREYAISTDSDIYLYNIETGKTTNLCKPSTYKTPAYDFTRSLQHQAVNAPLKEGLDYNLGYDTNPSFSANGKYIAWQSMERDGYESDRNRLCVYELETGKKTYVTEQFDSNVDAYTWANDNKTLYFVGTWHGTTHVYSTNLKGQVKKITNGQYDYTDVALCGKSLLCGRQSMKEAKEYFLVDVKKGNATQLTHENQYFRDNIDWGDVLPRTCKSVDGKDILSWIVLPPRFDANKMYPALLFCEGGPQSPVSQFWSYRWNMQIMAANGYIVVCPNRRGLPGFGQEWLEEISTNYTGRCMDDYKSAIDDACKLPYVDKNRLGCVGASFGGFSVYWLAGNHDKRFKAFIAHDGIYNLEAQYTETEEAWFTNWDLGGAPWLKDDATIQRTFQNSPHKFIDKWDTPILCIHGEKDYRIVASQAMSAFNAARYRGVPAQLLIFPDENHWVLKPQNGILWQRTFFAWLDKWVKKN